MPKIIGRKKQQQMLAEAVASPNPEFVAVYGRRRIGKTFLVKQFFDGKFDFYMTGAFNASRRDLLAYFNQQLEEYSGHEWPTPKNWLEAFRQLREYLNEKANKQSKLVVFIDELPWFDTRNSGFFSAFELFWNGWADSCPGLKFIVCGSATTWMTNRLIADKGGLHNRVTRRIYLGPFNLWESEQLLDANGVRWNRHQIIEAYMIFGGTPFYLNKISASQSLAQNVDRLFFEDEGELKNEYHILFRSLFKDSSVYHRVVELLAKKAKGMRRDEIISQLGVSDGGKLTEVLGNLVSCDFLRPYKAFGQKERDVTYQLSDLFTLFYLKHVKGNPNAGAGFWSSRLDSPAHRAWSGYAFEQVCMHHVPQIKAALGIAGIQSEVSAWASRGPEQRSAQIDLVIDRRDQIINLCEMKFSLNDFEITSVYMKQMIERMELFRAQTKTRKGLHLTMLTVSGLRANKQSGMIQNSLTAENLFTDA